MNRQLMKQEQDKWIENVMNSHKGKARLVPSEFLFEKIMKRNKKVRTFRLRQMIIAGVAACFLLLMNSVAIQSINRSTSDTSEFAYEDQLISDYNLYEYE